MTDENKTTMLEHSPRFQPWVKYSNETHNRFNGLN